MVIKFINFLIHSFNQSYILFFTLLKRSKDKPKLMLKKMTQLENVDKSHFLWFKKYIFESQLFWTQEKQKSKKKINEKNVNKFFDEIWLSLSIILSSKNIRSFRLQVSERNTHFQKYLLAKQKSLFYFKKSILLK